MYPCLNFLVQIKTNKKLTLGDRLYRGGLYLYNYVHYHQLKSCVKIMILIILKLLNQQYIVQNHSSMHYAFYHCLVSSF